MATIFKNILNKIKANANEVGKTIAKGAGLLGNRSARTKVTGENEPRIFNGLPVVGATAVRSSGGLFSSRGASVSVQNSSVEDIENKITQPIFSDTLEKLPPPIVNRDPNYLGTENADIQNKFRIFSNVKGATIFVNGENTFKETPNSLNFFFSDILKDGQKVITLEKQGYVAEESYIINVISNRSAADEFIQPEPVDYSIQGYDSFFRRNDVTARDSIFRPNLAYSSKPRYLFNVTKVVGTQTEILEVGDAQLKNLQFTLNTKKADVPTEEDKNDITVEVSAKNPLAVKVTIIRSGINLIRGSQALPITLQAGLNKISAPKNSKIKIESADLTSYRIIQIEAVGKTTVYETQKASNSISLSTTLDLVEDISFGVTTEDLEVIVLDIPTIKLNNPSVDRIYNKNTNTGLPIGITKTGTLTRLVAYVNNKEFNFSELGNTNGSGEANLGIVIPANVITTIGRYKVVLIPYNVNDAGDPIEILYNVVDDVFVGVPDIFDITYPSEIRAADYVGTDVNFKIKFDSKDTTYVRIYFGEAWQQIPASGEYQLNVQQALDLLNKKYTESETDINFSLRLVPYNTSGKEVVEGKSEIISIKFNKGKLFVPRAVAINRITDSFKSLLDFVEAEDESSKYLTHLLHLGSGNNKVITTWTGSKDSLILKLYEPIGTDIQPNDLVWISKPQSNPIIETVTLVSNPQTQCNSLKGPNFLLEIDNGIGWSVYDELISNGSETSTQLVNKIASGSKIDTTKLDILYVSGSELLFQNFVNYSSAEERVNNFYYKVQLVEAYQSKYNSIMSGSGGTSSDVYNNAQRYKDSINEIVNNFDGFENFLYTDTEYDTTLSYPKDINGNLKASTHVDSVAWLDYISSLSNYYDRDNPNYLVNNIPEFIKEDYNNEDFFLFLNMIGNHFDILWMYINAFARNKISHHKKNLGVIDDMVFHMLESFGWDTKKAFDSQFLWEYAFGLNKDGSQKYGMSLADANQEVWRRILNNLPYLLKHKGTARAMKAIMACYGVPQSMLTIMEFGGPQDPTRGGVTQFTFDDRTAAITLDEQSSIKVPWHDFQTEGYPNCIELRVLPSKIPNTIYNIVSGSEWSLDLVSTTGSFAKLELNFGGDIAASPYMETPFISASVSTTYFDTSIEYVLGPDVKTGSLDFPISTEYYSNIAINRYNSPGTGSWYEVWLATTDGQRIITSVSMSLFTLDSQWETGSTLQIGGGGYAGNVDEFRLWRVPLQKSKFNNHTLFPDAINGNSYTASTSDLIFRLDFEYPKDRTSDNNIKNVAINDGYGEAYAYAQNFYSASSYPYQYDPYDRTVTANVPSSGFGYGNKIRFEDIEIESGKTLSHKARATKKSFDRAPIDSNRLGLFFSPIKELNMDILKAFGDFNIDNYIGDPRDEYKDEYRELDKLREYYFQRLDRNINEYIQLVKYINKSLFDVLEDVTPARAKISKGLLIEPHFLERSKTKWIAPVSERLDYDVNINVDENNIVDSSYESKDADLDATNLVVFDNSYDVYDTVVDNMEIINLEGTNPNYESTITAISDNLMEVTYPTYPPFGSANVECYFEAELLGQADTFKLTEIGMGKNSLSNLGFGLYGKNGVATVSSINIFGNKVSSKQNVFLIKEKYNEKIPTQTGGWPRTNSGQVVYENVIVEKYKYYISLLPLAPGNETGPAVTDTVVQVTPLHGYFPTHYKFVGNLSEGLQRSYYKGSVQNSTTTPDGLDPVEIFTTNPNILKVANTGRGSGEPILEVD